MQTIRTVHHGQREFPPRKIKKNTPTCRCLRPRTHASQVWSIRWWSRGPTSGWASLLDRSAPSVQADGAPPLVRTVDGEPDAPSRMQQLVAAPVCLGATMAAAGSNICSRTIVATPNCRLEQGRPPPAATHGLRRCFERSPPCCKRRPQLLPTVSVAATNRPPPLLQTAAASAPHSLCGCYYLPPSLLPTASVVATTCRRPCCKWSPPLLPTAFVAATHGGSCCYCRLTPLLPTASAAATTGCRPCCKWLPPLLPTAVAAASIGRRPHAANGRRPCCNRP